MNGWTDGRTHINKTLLKLGTTSSAISRIRNAPRRGKITTCRYKLMQSPRGDHAQNQSTQDGTACHQTSKTKPRHQGSSIVVLKKDDKIKEGQIH